MSELHDRLTALGAGTRWPQPPDLVPRVRAAIADAAAPQPRRGRLPVAFARPPAAVLAGALLALFVAGLLAAAPGVRSALLRTLGLQHAQVTRVYHPPSTTLGTRLELGKRSTLAPAQKRAGFRLRRPAALGAPEEVYMYRGAVTCVYRMTTGRLIHFQQVRGSTAPYIRKYARTFRRVDVAGAPGLLVKGPHVMLYDQRPGGPREQASRLAKTALLWERDGLLLRLEADLPENEMLRIARSVT